MKIVTEIKTIIKQLLTKRYCAIQAIDNQQYILSAIAQWQDTIEVTHLCCDTLPILTKYFHTYPLAVTIPQHELVIKNWFFPKSFTLFEIYCQIANNQVAFTKENFAAFDLAAHPSESDEQLIIGYFLPTKIHQQLVSQYETLGWQLIAIEPENLVAQRQLNKTWQLQTKDTFAEFYQQNFIYHSQIELTLKLLDSEELTR